MTPLASYVPLATTQAIRHRAREIAEVLRGGDGTLRPPARRDGPPSERPEAPARRTRP